jgi:alkaline phosphatase D
VARGPGVELVSVAEAKRENDETIVWDVSGLEPSTRYQYEIRRADQTIFSAPDASFTTQPPQSAPSVTRLVIGSCAREQDGDRTVWRRMATLDPHAVVLLGDCPYIDSTDLTVQRTRYGEFATVTEFADLLRSRPLYATWDDHDFGANDTNGLLPGKENAQQAFIEYHANPSYGNGREGVYTKFRVGGVEIFLLDTRYFAATARSPIADGPTLLGAAQWEWLRAGLRASDAPFKVLASGLIWNGAVRPGKPDHWDTYPEEREAIFRFLGEEEISGVVLMGGDIHRTRVLRYETRELVGYPLTELITSPIHSGVIVEANAPHPALIHDSGEPHSFLLMTVDTTVSPPTLHARFQNAQGRELYSLTLNSAELTAA